MGPTTCSIALFVVAAAGLAVWISLHYSPKISEDNPNENNDTTVQTPVLATKALIIFSDGAVQTVLEFDPSTKSLAELQLPGVEFGNIMASTQNADFGALMYKSDVNSDLEVALFDKHDINYTAFANIGQNYDKNAVAISGENVLLLSYMDISKCQSISILSPQNNEIIENSMNLKTCRYYSDCTASLRTGDVYIFGGLSNNMELIPASEKYSVEHNTMQVIADLPDTNLEASGKPFCKTAEYNGSIMVCDNDGTYELGCYIYNLRDNTWEIVGGFVNDRDHYELVLIANDLFAIGGYGGGNGIDSIEMYNQENKSWEIFMDDIAFFDGGSKKFAAFTV